MASASQYMMEEDQTDDEDFFDKLVDDSYSPSSQAQASSSSSAKHLTFDDGSDSDDVRAFSNGSVGDVPDGDGTLNEAADPGNNVANEGSSEVDVVQTDANKLSDDVPLSETAKESSKVVNESGTHGVKEIDWGAFGVDSSVNDGRGFGSYSDFFTEFDGQLQGKVEVDVVAGGNDTNNTTVVASAGFEQHQGEMVQDSTSGQYVDDNSQSWENMYPGWRYDANTGQWYQVDASINSQGSYGNSANNWEGVASTDNSTSGVAGTAWNQASQVVNGYPEHMVFDAQYPGWYYDTIAQEWRSLDSYNQASQTAGAGQAHDQQVQNGHSLTAMYHSNTESSMYNVNDTKQTFKGQEFGIQSQQGSWDQSYYANNQQATNTWQSENGSQAEAAVTSASSPNFGGNQQVNNLYRTGSVAEQFKPNEMGVQGFIPQHMNVASITQNGPLSFSNDFYNGQQQYVDDVQSFQSNQLFSPSAGRSPDGRPPHALVNFGFGGKLIVVKDDNGSLQNSSFGSQVSPFHLSFYTLGSV